MLSCKIDTPFTESIYAYELIKTGRTLAGISVIEKLSLPSISALDLLQEIRFCTGRALGAIIASRNGYPDMAADEFSKSCLFAARCLIIIERKRFPLTYEEIGKLSKDADTGEYVGVIQHAIEVRNGLEIEEPYLFKNISFQNIIKKRIWDLLDRRVDITLM